MNTSLRKRLIEEVIAELVQFSVYSKKQAVYLRFNFNCCARHPMHTKINGEYIAKIRCLRTPLSYARTQNIPRIQR